MMKILLILTILFVENALATDVGDAFARKDCMAVVEIFKQNQSRAFDKKDLIHISYCLRKKGFYRQDIRLNVRLIKKIFLTQHRKLLTDIKNSETIDGEEYPKGLKDLYWNLMNDYGQILESYKDLSTLIKKDHQHYLVFSKLLSELEFREKVVDKYNDKIVAHIQYLEKKVYRFSGSINLQYISWQTDSTLSGPSTKTNLLITNKGLCLGGDLGIENAFYHFYVDGCFFSGSGGVSSDNSSPLFYQQSAVPAYGVKVGPGASMIVSTSGSRIGVKLPFIYTSQKLQTPADSTYTVKQLSPLAAVATLYSRWQFGKNYVQTEFGKYLQTEQTFWGIGLGRSF